MKKIISKACTGDVICADRRLYLHYGVYDNGKVIDFSPPDNNNALANKHNANVRIRSLSDFLNGDSGYIDNSPGFHSSKKTIKRARAEIGTGKSSYDLIYNNCEHKAREWQTGSKQSKQVDNAIEKIVSFIARLTDWNSIK